MIPIVDESHVANLEAALRDARARLDQIREKNRADVDSIVAADIALGDLKPHEAPLARVVTALGGALDANVTSLRRELESKEREAARDLEFRRKYPDTDDERRTLRESVDADRAAAIARLRRDLGRAETAAKGLRDDPTSVLLPLGTTVRVAEFELLDGDWPMPVAGTVGVVTGYSTLKGRPNVVSFARDVKETDGSTVLFDEDEANRVNAVNYLSSDLEVVSNGALLSDGLAVDAPGWTPTHGHGVKGDILYSESMVVVADGRLWRIQPCSGPPELTQITTDDVAGRKTFSFLKPLATSWKSGPTPNRRSPSETTFPKTGFPSTEQ